MQLRSGAESSQIARVPSGAGWWTDTRTDTTIGLRGVAPQVVGELYRIIDGANGWVSAGNLNYMGVISSVSLQA